MTRTFFLPILLTTILATTLAADGNSTSRVPVYSLEDQFERRWKHSDFAGQTVVYVISDRDGYSYSANWTTPLIKEYGKRVKFVPIADVRGVPGFLKGYIRGRFRGEFKYPVLLDWEGTIATAVQFTAGYPNLMIVDANRSILYKTAGSGTAAQLLIFRTQLNAILDKAK